MRGQEDRAIRGVYPASQSQTGGESLRIIVVIIMLKANPGQREILGLNPENLRKSHQDQYRSEDFQLIHKTLPLSPQRVKLPDSWRL